MKPRRRTRRTGVALALIAGGALAVAWLVARGRPLTVRQGSRGSSPRLFDWVQAEGLALRIARHGRRLSAAERAELETQYRDRLQQVAGPLRAYTGGQRDLTGGRVAVLDRQDWVLANIPGLRRLLGPVEAAFAQREASSAFLPLQTEAVARGVLSGELGLLLGYLSRHVLGQYDIALLGGEAPEPGALYFVEPNIEALQFRLGLPGQEFRLWLTLHETTHAYEFEEHPWVRQYFDETLAAYLGTMVDQLKDGGGLLSPDLSAFLRSVRSGESVIEAMMNDEQRALFWRLQALMTVLEGYATHVMNAVGRELLTYYREIEERVEGRWQRRGLAQTWLLRLTGLELKLEQYRLGDAFFDYVDMQRGPSFAQRLWIGPENLPTPDEIRHPSLWITRMEGVAA